MSNSKLVNYTRISPHRTRGRNHKIDKITIHHMAGNLSVETCGNVFQTRQASTNYGIGTDGRIGMYVEEKDRAWATANPPNDNRAINIELANDVVGGNWHVSDTAIEKCIDLCVDICKRNGISKLNFTGDKSGNLTMHKYFIATTCPGQYLASKFPYIAKSVNEKLGKPSKTPSKAPSKNSGMTVKQAVKYGQKKSNEILGTKIKEDGIRGKDTKINGIKIVQWAMNKDYRSGLKIDGKFGTLSKRALGNHYVLRGETQYMVTACEILLYMNGYNPGGVEIPGTFGSGLNKAVGQYQKASKLKVDYSCGKNTFKKLMS